MKGPEAEGARTRGERRRLVSIAAGLDTGPAAMLARLAQGFEARITVAHNRSRADAKSILGILTLAVAAGAEVTVIAEGQDAEVAVCAIERLLSGGNAKSDVSCTGPG